MGVLGASLVMSEKVYGTDFNFASARSTGVRDRPDLSYRVETIHLYPVDQTLYRIVVGCDIILE